MIGFRTIEYGGVYYILCTRMNIMPQRTHLLVRNVFGEKNNVDR